MVGDSLSATPALKSFPAIGQQLFVALKIQLKTIFGRNIVFAIVIGILTTNLRALVIDSAFSVIPQMTAAVIGQQKPAVLILVYLDILVRHLPKQMIEIVLRARRFDMLCDIGAAFRTGA